MPSDAFVDALNEQIGHEYAAHQQYVAIAVYYDAETLPQLARFFYRQALEERDHAMMMVQYLLDADADVVDPRRRRAAGRLRRHRRARSRSRSRRRSASPSRSTRSPAAPAHEGDYTSEQFMQWFIKEQVEEVATMSDLLRVVERSQDDAMDIEDYLAREHLGRRGRRPDRAGPRRRHRLIRRSRSRDAAAPLWEASLEHPFVRASPTGRWRTRSSGTSARTTCS